MAETRRHSSIEPAHPGEILADILIPATGRTKADIASLLGISRQALYDILRKRQGVTPRVAVRLGKLFGDGAAVWLRMQQAHDLWHAERALAEEIKAIPTLKAA